jgi:MHS family proline/betaine transporter-like MFS transporter
MAGELVTAFAFPTVQSVIVYLILGYFPTFAQKYVGLSASQSLWSTALATVMMGCFCVLSGWCSDKIGRKPSLYAASILFALVSYPAISLLVNHPGLTTALMIQSAMAALCGVFLGSMSAALVEHFPTSRRLTGMTIAYNLQSVIFGGFAPFIASWLIVKTGAPVSIAYFIIFAAVVSLFGVSRMQETARQELR